MNPIKSKFKWLFLMGLLALGACGNKGDLYVPEPESSDSQASHADA